MRRWIVCVGVLMTGILAGCSGGPPPIPQSITVAPVATDTTATTATTAAAVETASATIEATAANTQLPTVEATGVNTAQPTAEPTLAPTSAPELTSAPTSAPTGTTEATTAPATGSVQPLNAAACEQLWGEVARALGTDVERTTAPFENAQVGNGTSCHLVATGTGAQFKSFQDVASDLRALLISRDWVEDISFQADGPTGTANGYRKGGSFAIVSVGWEPAAGVECSGPIAACDIPLEKQNFTITLDLVDVGE